MAAKLVILILSLAFVGSSTLVIRQQRLLAYAEMTRVLRAGRQLDREIYAERVRLANALQPERIEQLAERLGPLKPMPREQQPLLTPFEPHRELMLEPASSPALLSVLRWEEEQFDQLNSHPDDPFHEPAAWTAGSLAIESPRDDDL